MRSMRLRRRQQGVSFAASKPTHREYRKVVQKAPPLSNWTLTVSQVMLGAKQLQILRGEINCGDNLATERVRPTWLLTATLDDLARLRGTLCKNKALPTPITDD
jgi:hypothetical protein